MGINMGKSQKVIIPFEQFLKKLDSSGTYIDVQGDFSNFLHTSGVWACYGINKKKPSGWECLNVGQCKRIGIEMRNDLKYSRGKFSHKQGEYRNYNNKIIFEFKRPNDEPITIQERVWKHIGDNYENLHFVVILKSKNEDIRLLAEMKFAEDKQAKYWNYSPKQRKLKAKSLAEQ